MGIFDQFFSNIKGADDSSSEVPSIGDVSADWTNLDNIVSGKAKAADYGAGVGAVAGSFFGDPQLGANIGRQTLPAVGNALKGSLDGLKDAISK